MCAKPQLEDGHTQIANEILEQLMKFHLSPNQWQVLLCVIRKTYGFHKKVDRIANSQIVEATGLCKAVVSRTLHGLEEVRVIMRNGKHIGFQKDWEQWKKLAEQSTISPTEKVSSLVNSTPKVSNSANNEKLAILSTELAESSTELAESSTKVSSPAVTQKIKDTITKETIQKKESTKKVYGQFKNVFLTDREYQKLKDKFGQSGSNEKIEALSEGIASRDYKYHSHYATILSWHRRDEEKGGQSGAHKGNPRALPTKYTRPEEL